MTITRGGRLPEIPLLADPAATLILYTGADLDVSGVAATVQVERRRPDDLTPSAVLAHLANAHGVRLLLCEGGPSLFGSLVAGGLCDELFLTLAPKLAGGAGQPITVAMRASAPSQLRLLWTLAEDDSLYLRYAVAA